MCFVRAAAAGRDVELNVAVQQVVPGADRRRAAERFSRLAADLSVEQRLELPTLMAGTARDENMMDALASAIEHLV